MEKKTLYVILGGSQENMKMRADTVLAYKKKVDGIIVVAGLPEEVKYMQAYCQSKNQKTKIGKGSWDTLSNITRDIIPHIKTVIRTTESIHIIAPTGPSHAMRNEIAWKLFAQKYHQNTWFFCPPSGEVDSPNEPKLLFLYRLGKFSILLLYWLAKMLRVYNKKK